MLYSEGLEEYNGTLPASIVEALEEVKVYMGIIDFPILKIDDFNIAIPLTLKINLPSKHNHDSIDVKGYEPVLLTFNINNYPLVAPKIKSDRKDFPVANLSHLYVVREGIPATLCLVREDLDEWFANRRISDLISVAKQWYSKAANGILTEDGDEFEPVRLEGYQGYSIYKYKSLVDIVENNKSFDGENSFSILVFSMPVEHAFNKSASYRFLTELSKSRFEKEIKFFSEANVNSFKLYREGKKNSSILVSGVLVWDKNGSASNQYNTSLPSNLKELSRFCSDYSIDVDTHLSAYINLKNDELGLTNFIPVIVAIRRPRKIIGFSSNVEFFHFIIDGSRENISEGKLKPDTVVFFQAHREPVNDELAKMMSLRNNSDKTIFVGGGALGSKIIFNYARSGNLNITVIDNDLFSPHNIVRHDLFSDSAGKNKAKEIVNKIERFIDDDSSLNAIESNIFFVDEKVFSENKWLIDTTASLNVQNWLVSNKKTNTINRARAEVAFNGMLGFLYIEGRNQNPRIDDLVNYVYFLGIQDSVISEWLVSENKKLDGNDYDIVDIGIGCNSPTVVMSNDSMSFHASIFSKILSTEHNRVQIKDSGLINISYISDSGYAVKSRSLILPEFYGFKCLNNSGWEIRMLPSVIDQMTIEAKKYKKKETGGVFIGNCNYKTKTIHVFDIIISPSDSKRSSIYFFRGIKNLPDKVRYIREKTGNMIGYIGEWHTHPMGLDRLSSVDLRAVETLKPLNDQYPIPTFVSVLSRDKFLPFVF